jgi:hypothetical protein
MSVVESLAKLQCARDAGKREREISDNFPHALYPWWSNYVLKPSAEYCFALRP